jgi:uncharacterized protein (TIGR02118 family)
MKPVIKFMILFRQVDDSEAFETRYNDFLALTERIPNVARRQVVSVLGSPVGEPPYFRILEIYFNDLPTMEAALRSRQGQEAGGELTRRFPHGTFEAVFAEVYEEAGGSTPTG